MLVVNFDPLVPSEGNRHLYEIFGWNSPFDLAREWQRRHIRCDPGIGQYPSETSEEGRIDRDEEARDESAPAQRPVRRPDQQEQRN